MTCADVMTNFDFESGRRLLEEGDLAEGIRCLLASLDLDPANIDAYIELFGAYQAAWQVSGDPLVLDQMRKVAIAGLRRASRDDQRRTLEHLLDHADALLLESQGAGDEHDPAAPDDRRRLPVIRDDPDEHHS